MGKICIWSNRDGEIVQVMPLSKFDVPTSRPSTKQIPNSSGDCDMGLVMTIKEAWLEYKKKKHN